MLKSANHNCFHHFANESERRKQYTRSLSYTKICYFGKIQLKIQWHKFTPISPAKGQLSYQLWKSGKSLTYMSFQVLTQTRTRFTKFSLKSRRTQAPISLECKSRLASRVILALETLVTSVLKEKKKIKNERNMERLNERRNTSCLVN